MVKIAVAGDIASEIVDVLPRPIPQQSSPAVTYATTDYSSVSELTDLLRGCSVMLSFVTSHPDAFQTQKNLIDASVAAGVRRIAPSEWASPRFDHTPWYDFKAQTRTYLETLKREKPGVVEYCLFQPGLLTNYLTYPHRSAKHLSPIMLPFNFGARRMIVPCRSDSGAKITFTTVHDLANVVARAIEFEGEWPVMGGIRGSDLTFAELIALGGDVRGSIKVNEIDLYLLEAGTWTNEWYPKIEHNAIPPEQREAMSKAATASLLLAANAGAWETNGAWNGLLPDYSFESAKEFLAQAWDGRP
ncbi:hypothetical protein E8E13_007669 [Curvularia kusanoi]|uniref:NmrA-like domain-containing protein n=1 Tax=Curvularia kusanoi TaxID=90978 RepID=A0A9P4WBI6_CURKU|nr:hypothetical protein E8E13_007669 [Curvularia kusanoi]